MPSVRPVACLLVVLTLAAGEAKPGKPGRWSTMDYGPFLTAGLGLGTRKDCDAPKGVIVRLDRTAPVQLCFDTDALRVAVAWHQGFIDWKGLTFAGGFGRGNYGPNLVGEIIVANRQAPGWAKDGAFADPRREHDGPLPREWAKYRGLHLHGERVVFSYSVGDCAVLEAHAVRRAGGALGIVRQFTIGPSRLPLTVQIADEPGATGGSDAAGAWLTAGKGVLAAGLVAAPAGAAWTVADGQIRLALPPLAEATSFAVVVARFADGKREALAGLLAGPAEDLRPLTSGGPGRWKEEIATTGVLGKEDGMLAVDTLGLPEANAGKSWLRMAAFDFFADGRRAALSTWNGDVWMVSGIDAELKALKWRRFATGLYEPLGLRIVGDVIHVLGKDQITRLHDRDGDGEADFHECFSNDVIATRNYHEFCFGLETDAAGDFFFTKGAALVTHTEFDRVTPHHGCLLKVARDGSRLTVVATGFRAPNGLAIGPQGEITVSDNQGNWMPVCPLNLVRPGGFYGMVDVAHNQAGTPMPPRHQPMLWLPMKWDNSAGGQVWVPPQRWGPLAGALLHCSYGRSSLFHVLIDRVGDTAQAAAVRLPASFASGIMRARFNPVDGHCYVVGLRGWQTNAASDGCFQRVRWTGTAASVPVAWRATATGVALTFSGELASSAAELGNWSGEWYNVVATKDYGSAEFSVSEPRKKVQKPEALPIRAAALSADRRTVELTIDGMRPVTNLLLKGRVDLAGGGSVPVELAATVHALPGAGAAK